MLKNQKSRFVPASHIRSQSTKRKGRNRVGDEAAVLLLADFLGEDLYAVAASFGERPASLLEAALDIVGRGGGRPGEITGRAKPRQGSSKRTYGESQAHPRKEACAPAH